MFVRRAAAHPPPPPVRTLSLSVLIGRRTSLRRKRSRKRRLRETRLPDRSQKIDGRPSSFQWEQETSGPRRLITPQQDSEYGVTHCCRLVAMQTGGGGVTEVAELFFRESHTVKTAGRKQKITATVCSAPLMIPTLCAQTSKKSIFIPHTNCKKS